RAPISPLLVPRQKRLAPGKRNNVEVPAAQPVLIVRLINRAYRDRDAETFQGWLVEQKHAFEERRVSKEFNFKRLSGLRVDDLLIAHLVAGLSQEPQGLAQIVADSVLIAIDRIGIRLGEYLGRNLVAHWFEQLKFAAGR